MGHCRSSVCVEEVPQKLLKRKKRFICLYTIGRIIHLRRQRKRLRAEIGQLRQQLADSRNTYNEEERRADARVNPGAERFGGGINSPYGGEASGPEISSGLDSGTRSLDFPGRGGGAPALTGASPNDLEVGRIPDGEIGTLGGPRNANYGGGYISPDDDEALSAGQVRLRDNGGARATGTTGSDHVDNMGGSSRTGEFDSPSGRIERGGRGDVRYLG